jgi:hypothetical protein
MGAGLEANRNGIDFRCGRQSAKLKNDRRRSRARGIGNRERVGTATGDDPGNMGAMAIRIGPAVWRIEKNSAKEIRVIGIHAGVVHINEDIGSAKPKIVGGCGRVRSDPDGNSAEVIGRDPWV